VICYRAEIRPCENILCPKDISEKETTLGSLIVSSGFLNVLKSALSPTYNIRAALVINAIMSKYQVFDFSVIT
jgi:hypothetical protein